MLTFTDLIQLGVASARYTNVITNETPEMDRIVINYNNIWGCITDTHMTKKDDIYIITGSLLRDKKKTEHLMYSRYWGGYDFSQASVCCNSLFEFVYKNGLCAQHDVINGDDVLIIKKYIPESEPTDPQALTKNIPSFNY
jgi:hypothetical protein